MNDLDHPHFEVELTRKVLMGHGGTESQCNELTLSSKNGRRRWSRKWVGSFSNPPFNLYFRGLRGSTQSLDILYLRRWSFDTLYLEDDIYSLYFLLYFEKISVNKYIHSIIMKLVSLERDRQYL